jgi:hypothetical protein
MFEPSDAGSSVKGFCVLIGSNNAQQLEKYLRVGWRASKVQRTV